MGASSWVRVGTRGAPKPHGAPLPPQELPPPWMLDADSQKPPKGKWSTPPFDPRFPNQNQTQNCYQNFLGETLQARLGAGAETGEAGRGVPHLKMRRGSGTRLGSETVGEGPTRQGRGLVWRGRHRALEEGRDEGGEAGPGRQWVGPGVGGSDRDLEGRGLVEWVSRAWWAGVWSWRRGGLDGTGPSPGRGTREG